MRNPVKEWYDREFDIKITRVEIVSEHGAKAMGKPMGKYMTLEAEDLRELLNELDRMCIEEIKDIEKAEEYARELRSSSQI